MEAAFGRTAEPKGPGKCPNGNAHAGVAMYIAENNERAIKAGTGALVTNTIDEVDAAILLVLGPSFGTEGSYTVAAKKPDGDILKEHRT